MEVTAPDQEIATAYNSVTGCFYISAFVQIKQMRHNVLIS